MSFSRKLTPAITFCLLVTVYAVEQTKPLNIQDAVNNIASGVSDAVKPVPAANTPLYKTASRLPPPAPKLPKTQPFIPNPLPAPAPSSQARQFLNAHNQIRQKYGEPELVWDARIARHARRWAAKRIVDCDMIHSYGPYGENLFWAGGDRYGPADIVNSWISEEKNYDPKLNRCKPGEMCGHYTQIVWKDTVRVGCAKQRCKNGGIYVICNYDPPGNYVEENPFTGHASKNLSPIPSAAAPSVGVKTPVPKNP